MAIEFLGQQAFETPPLIARLLDNPATLFLTRIFLTMPYWVGGLMKLFDWQGGKAEMAKMGLRPAWAFNLAVVIVELVGSALVIGNWATWLGAGALGCFTFLSTFLAHRFWRYKDDARAAELNSFLEHATICAGFILIVVVGLRAGP